ncbi:MAG: protein-export chaperone SecB [Holosporales bacterium]|jgi:preprotein translocase subunit SecB|nr:protein-export chaperone SecB [Holosporales bacterium]
MAKKETPKETPAPSISILAQYIKDLSFEAPGATRVSREAVPDLQINMHVSTSSLEKSTHAVLLETKASAAQGKETLFVLELVYAGVFSLESIPENMLPLALYIECPRLLFPFVRNIVAHITGEGSFPPLYLAPVDFMAMYEKHQASNSIH